MGPSRRAMARRRGQLIVPPYFLCPKINYRGKDEKGPESRFSRKTQSFPQGVDGAGQRDFRNRGQERSQVADAIKKQECDAINYRSCNQQPFFIDIHPGCQRHRSR